MKARVEKLLSGRYRVLILALVYSNAVSLFLFFLRVLGSEGVRFWFLFWNLALAWVPLLFAWLLTTRLRSSGLKTIPNTLLGLGWLVFLPNSFYILSDLIHVHLTGEVNILFDVVLFMSCIFNAYVFGYLSLLLIHRELLQRLKPRMAHTVVGVVLLACSFAVYLGRYLRWNSWDVLIQPFALLFDISDRVVNPAAYPQTFVTTLTFFLLLSSMYWVIFALADLQDRRG